MAAVANKSAQQEPKETRTRRAVLINDQLYGKVASEATIARIDNGQVIDRALEFYFNSKQN